MISVNILYSQPDSSGLLNNLPAGLKINGYIDAYYASDNNGDAYLREFSAIAPYRDDFKLNFISLEVRYSSERFRANAVIHFGDVPNVTWPSDNRYIQEANIGFMPVKNFWVDAGYLLTHIGGEGVIPKNNYLTSIALCTYFEPFFQSGIRLSYDFSDKLSAQLHILNGYNVFSDAHNHKSGGVELDYKPDSKVEIIYNNLLGNENTFADNAPRLRFYNNLVVKVNPSGKLGIIICNDYCLQEKSSLPDRNSSAGLFSGFVSAKYNIVKKLSVAARGEYYFDKNGILSGTYVSGTDTTGLKAYGFTLGFECNPVSFGYIRIEARYLKAENNIFSSGKNNRLEGILSAGAEF